MYIQWVAPHVNTIHNHIQFPTWQALCLFSYFCHSAILGLYTHCPHTVRIDMQLLTDKKKKKKWGHKSLSGICIVFPFGLISAFRSFICTTILSEIKLHVNLEPFPNLLSPPASVSSMTSGLSVLPFPGGGRKGKTISTISERLAAPVWLSCGDEHPREQA